MSQTKPKQPWLELRNIEVWQNNRSLVDRLSLMLRLGESTTVLGPNGSGKSTLVKLIERRLHPVVKQDSWLRLFGEELIPLQQLRQRIGVVNSELDERIPAQLTAHDVVLSGLFGSTRLGQHQQTSRDDHRAVQRRLEELNLIELESRQYCQLSDGEKRRLLIARAVIHRPEILILDEPARALDLRSCHQMLTMIQQLCRLGVTVVQVTHRIDTIVPEMKRVVLLKAGQVVDDGSPSEMLTSSRLSALFDTQLTVLDANGYRQVVPHADCSEQL